MRTWTRALAVVALSVAAGFAGCGKEEAPAGGGAAGGGGAGGAAATKKISLAVIPKGTQHVFWKSVEAGARAAAKDLGVEMQWKGPLQENDRAGQIQVLEQYVQDKVSGIVIAPLDDVALVRPIREANSNNIPVVLIDSGLKGEPGKDFVSFVATDNRRGGEMGGEQLAKLLDGKGKVVLLRYLEGSASTREREEGFLSVMAKNPGITVTVSNRYGGPGASDAKTISLQLADQVKEANGIFCSNEPTVFGMLLALRDLGLAGKVKFVGFDASDDLLAGLKNKEIDALVAQNPQKMGYEGVATMVKHLRGEKVPDRVDSGAGLITRENVDTEEIRKLLGK